LGEEIITHQTKSTSDIGFYWRGVISEDVIKEILSNKQFQKWKRGEQTEFIKHFSIQERKDILKHNNKKKNG